MIVLCKSALSSSEVSLLETESFVHDLRTALAYHRTSFAYLIVVVVLVTFFCLGLFTSSGLPAGTDLLVLPTQLGFIKKHFLWFSLWTPLDSFGYPMLFGTQFNFVLMLFSLIPDVVLATKLYLYGVFLLAGFSMYFFAYHYVKHRVASLLAAIVYVFNPIFILEVYAGHHTIIFGYALAPLLFLTYDMALITGKMRDIILSALLLLIFFVAGHPHTVYIFGSFLVLFALFEFLSPRGGKRRLDALKRVIKVSSIVVVFWALLSAYEILPLGFNVAWSSVLFSLGYTIEDTYAYSGEVYYIIWILLPIMVLLAVFLRKHRYALFFSLSSIVSSIVSMGPYPPFGPIFTWAFINIPLFNIFRVPYRFLMMTALSASFLIAFVIARESAGLKHGDLVSIEDKVKRLFLDLKASKKMLAALALISTIVGSSFYVALGGFGFPLSNFNLPDSYTETYEWIGQQPGDYRILTVPYPAHYVYSSLISGVNRGWVWDPPVYSQAIHGKVVITGYAGVTDASQFLNFLGNQMQYNRTDDLMRLLGTFDTKYVIVHPYPLRDNPQLTEPLRAFFGFQKGLKTVYQSDNVTVMENQYWTPLIFAAENYGLVVGGSDVLMSLMKVDSFDLNEWVLLSANQLDSSLFDELSRNASVLVFSNEGFRDLVMMADNAGVKIRAAEYAYPSSNAFSHWIRSSWWADRGKLVMNGVTLRTNGSNALDIPFTVDMDGDYTTSLRVGFAPHRGNLAVFLDGSLLISFRPDSNGYSGLRWIDTRESHLEKGNHVLRLENSAPGLNDIDEIFVSPSKELHSQIETTRKTIASTSARLIYVLEAEDEFTYQDLFDWRIEQSPETSNGLTLAYAYNQTSSRLSSDIFVSRPGEYIFSARVNSDVQGKISINLDNSPEQFTFPSSNSVSGWQWASIGPLNLTWGQHKIYVESTKASKLDELIINSVDPEPSLINEIFEEKSGIPLDYEQVDPSTYSIQVDNQKPFFIVFSESYHPLWKAYVDGNEVSAIPAYSFINAFYVPEGGSHSILLEFTGQKYVTYGELISLISITCLGTYLILGTRIGSFLRKKFGRTKNRA